MHFLISPFFHPSSHLFLSDHFLFIFLQLFCLLLLCGYTLLIAPCTVDPCCTTITLTAGLVIGRGKGKFSGKWIWVAVGITRQFPTDSIGSEKVWEENNKDWSPFPLSHIPLRFNLFCTQNFFFFLTWFLVMSWIASSQIICWSPNP